MAPAQNGQRAEEGETRAISDITDSYNNKRPWVTESPDNLENQGRKIPCYSLSGLEENDFHPF